MSHRIVGGALAETDYDDSAVGYENQRNVLGDEFLAVIDASIKRAALNPFAYQRIRRSPDVSRVLTKPFPYRIFFVLQSHDAIVVLRVLHNARGDREWKGAIPK